MRFKNIIENTENVNEARLASGTSLPGGIYIVSSSFSIGLGAWRKTLKKDTLLRVSPPAPKQEHGQYPMITNSIEKYDPIQKEWLDWKSDWGKYRTYDVEGIFTTIAKNITLVAKSESSKKVKELMEPKALVFENTKQAIDYLQGLPRKSKIRMEVQ